MFTFASLNIKKNKVIYANNHVLIGITHPDVTSRKCSTERKECANTFKLIGITRPNAT